MEFFANDIAIPDDLKTLIETVECENLSVLICDSQTRISGFIFDHCYQQATTFLRRTSSDSWQVYCKSSSKLTRENLYGSLSLHDACKTVLRLAREEKAQHGDNPIEGSFLHWSLDESDTLTFFGNGSMPPLEEPDFFEIVPIMISYEARAGNPHLPKVGDIHSMSLTPWNGNRVKKVVVSPGITSLCQNAFSHWKYFLYSIDAAYAKYSELQEIILPDTLVNLEMNCIRECPKLKKVYVPDSVKYISGDRYSFVFEGCPELTIYTPAGSYAEYYAKCHNIPTVTHPKETPTISNKEANFQI